MNQQTALTILKTGASVFLTGEPGAGKTHTVNAYIRYVRARNMEPAVTASTGIAATHISGMTIHSWSGIGIKSTLEKRDLDKIAKNSHAVARIQKAHVLIIDEVSMLSPQTVDMVDAVCRRVRENGEPFGGLQVVFVGDFFQLPPVQKSHGQETAQQSFLHESSGSSAPALFGQAGRFAYESGAWQRAAPQVCYLSEQYRQDDDTFLTVLSSIRNNTFGEGELAQVSQRSVAVEDAPESVPKLYAHNMDVDAVNTRKLATLGGHARRYTMMGEGTPRLVETLMKGCLSPQSLLLKTGAAVMCTKNNPREGYVNGSLGVVKGFDPATNYPVVTLASGRDVQIGPADWIVEDNNKPLAQITQLPLRLAWAITVHKSQGMSLDAAVMDLSRVFEYGQGYVALSRVRRLSGLYLLGFNTRSFEVHPDILAQDEMFRAMSLATETSVAARSQKEWKNRHDDFVRSCGGNLAQEGESMAQGWRNFGTGGRKKAKAPGKTSQKETGKGAFQNIRAKHPNAYRPWSEQEDQELEKLHARKTSVRELTKRFGRGRGAITSRLNKLGLRNC